MPDDRSHRYAWEAAHVAPGGPPPAVHAVAVIDDASRCGTVQLGDRNTQTFCRRPVGQRVDAMFYRHAPGVRWERRRPHLQLHRAADVAHLERCRACLAHMHQRWYREHGSRFEEWKEDMPLYPGRALIVEGPCAAYWPTYYRYQADVRDRLAARWLPEVRAQGPLNQIAAAVANAGLPASTLIDATSFVAEAIGPGPMEAALLAEDEAAAAREWHSPPLTLEERAERIVQGEIQEQRERARRRAVRILHELPPAPDEPADEPAEELRPRTVPELPLVRPLRIPPAERDAVVLAERRALELAEEVLTPEAFASLLQQGYVDLASGLNPPIGYRIRPWRRVGLLLRREEGWHELGASLCLHPAELYPSADEVVGMWLRLRHCERETLAAANLHSEAA